MIAACLIFGLLNGACRWLKRSMYWKPSGFEFTISTFGAAFSAAYDS